MTSGANQFTRSGTRERPNADVMTGAGGVNACASMPMCERRWDKRVGERVSGPREGGRWRAEEDVEAEKEAKDENEDDEGREDEDEDRVESSVSVNLS